ncbi:MAG: type II toxin-antitoxin system Phd/YefM family antitoxin [Rhodospirillaceae bacterium]|jgi:antitoxin Phd|nr:type II toxin-antitoxin system Phd/YefM family antitoxin [Rhodospirillaceae bacterium]
MLTTATELKNRLGQYLDEARVRPVEIEKNGRRAAVLISADEFDRLMSFEDAYWADQAREAEAEGYLGAEASESWLRKHLEDISANAQPRSVAKKR